MKWSISRNDSTVKWSISRNDSTLKCSISPRNDSTLTWSMSRNDNTEKWQYGRSNYHLTVLSLPHSGSHTCKTLISLHGLSPPHSGSYISLGYHHHTQGRIHVKLWFHWAIITTLDHIHVKLWFHWATISTFGVMSYRSKQTTMQTVALDEKYCYKESHQDLQCLPFCFWYLNITPICNNGRL